MILVRWWAAAAGAVVLAAGLSVAYRASLSTGWTWPANPALIPGLLSNDQEIALNASVYPVAIVPQTDTAALQRLIQLATTKSARPHRIGFVALIIAHPRSDRAAVITATRIVHRAGITLPWAVVLDPPGAWRTGTVQVYWPTAHGIAHAVGAAAFTAWRRATAPLPVASQQRSPHSTGPTKPTASSPKSIPSKSAKSS